MIQTKRNQVLVVLGFYLTRIVTAKEPSYGFFNAKELENKDLNYFHDEVGKLNLAEFKDIIENHVANKLYSKTTSQPKSVGRKATKARVHV